ncbi:MAG: helix-turn-helix transcriptional regulator, partial [Propionibacteriaceae bacterium]|nr:helix-turn-helix transcriptional regulator [Propionibacteriaceae bacterium]
DLADRLGVAQSVIARWETGERVPDAVAFSRVLAVAGLRLAVVADDGEAVGPMTDEAPLDGQRRRYPAHLDVRDDLQAIGGETRLLASHRGRRDAIRAREGVPGDHPTCQHLTAERRRRWEARKALRVAEAQQRREVRERREVLHGRMSGAGEKANGGRMSGAGGSANGRPREGPAVGEHASGWTER